MKIDPSTYDGPLIIALFANAQHGKSSAAEYLANSLEDSVRIPFAKSLKDFVSKLLNVPDENLNGTNEQKNQVISYGKSARYWLQWLGTQVGRQGVDPDLWLDKTLEAAIEAGENGKKFVIIEDGRFYNELRALYSLPINKRYIINVVRPDDRPMVEPTAFNKMLQKVLSYIGVDITVSHESEWEPYLMRSLPCDHRFDSRIHNDGDIMQFCHRLREYIPVVLARAGDR